MPPLTLGPIGQIARAVKNLAEAERFYRDVLGLYKHPDGLEEWLTFFHEPGGGLLSLISQVRP